MSTTSSPLTTDSSVSRHAPADLHEIQGQPAMKPRRAWLIIKPVPVPELGGDPIPYIRQRLAQGGVTCDVTVTQPDQPLAETVRGVLAQEPPPDLLIAAGGDGTHGPVGAALVGSDVPLGLISLGTFNNLARSLDIPRDIDAAIDIILHGKPHLVDAGRVNGRIFFEVAGAGWDATLFPLGEGLKRGKLEGLLTSARSVMGYRNDPITLLLDNERQVIAETPTVIVANGPYYGSSFAVSPGSRLDDGLLNVTVFDSFNKAELLAFMAAASEGGAVTDARVVSYRASRVEIVDPPDLPGHADGDPLGPVTTAFESIPRALTVLVPSGEPEAESRQTMKWSATDLPRPPAQTGKSRQKRTMRWQVPTEGSNTTGASDGEGTKRNG